jgi:hypothetical protein
LKQLFFRRIVATASVSTTTYIKRLPAISSRALACRSSLI